MYEMSIANQLTNDIKSIYICFLGSSGHQIAKTHKWILINIIITTMNYSYYKEQCWIME